MTGSNTQERQPVPGTTLFNGDMAQRGYALNVMCYSFNKEENREEFRRDEQAYCRKYNLTPAQRRAVAAKDVLGMIAEGGNVYYLAKLAGIWGLNVQDLGAAQTGMSVDAFKASLLSHQAKSHHLEGAM
ncbi:MAG: protocatechuate 4,5-dioxygenase subunit alpha [Parvularculaceae bacterium]